MADSNEKDRTEPADNAHSSPDSDKKSSAGEKRVLPEPGKVRLQRRDFIGKTLVGCGAVLGLELGYAGMKLLTSKPVGERKPVSLSLSQLPENSRTYVIYGGNKVEVIRTEKGVKARSMVCTHLGCLVIWNKEQKVYHCPCHGAYFDGDGNVISGPPTQPLEDIAVTISGNTVTIGG